MEAKYFTHLFGEASLRRLRFPIRFNPTVCMQPDALTDLAMYHVAQSMDRSGESLFGWPSNAETFLDLGTGCGNATVALIAHLRAPSDLLRIRVVDIDEAALCTAERNITQALTIRGCQIDVEYSLANALAVELAEGRRYDVVFSNGPYLPVGDAIRRGPARLAPASSLYAGADGLDFYRQVFPRIREVAGLFVARGPWGFDRANAFGDLFFAENPGIAYRLRPLCLWSPTADRDSTGTMRRRDGTILWSHFRPPLLGAQAPVRVSAGHWVRAPLASANMAVPDIDLITHGRR